MDTNLLSHAARLSDLDLLAHVKQLAHRERQATVALIAHLAELDARRLYLGEGYSSMFAYCTHALHLSESAAYRRIEAARAARTFPIILERLEDGSVSLTTARLLAPHLTPDNHRDLLDAARGASKREVEELVARLRPQPPVPDAIRKLPTTASVMDETLALLTAALAATPRSGAGDAAAPQEDAAPVTSMPAAAVPEPSRSRRGIVMPLAPERYKVSFTASAALHAKLRQAQALLRHQIPSGDLEQIVDRALTVLLRDLTKQKTAAVERPRDAGPRRGEEGGAEQSGAGHADSDSRHTPAVLRREVWARDGGRCAFVAPSGRRCGETGFLEYHHVVPYAHGGQATQANIELRCRAHNGYEAERELGQRASRWRGGARVREPQASYDIGTRCDAAVDDAAVGTRHQLAPERVPSILPQSAFRPANLGDSLGAGGVRQGHEHSHTDRVETHPILRRGRTRHRPQEIVQHRHRDGDAWGLLVPVIHHADRLGLLDIARRGTVLADAAREQRVAPADLAGGTFTITNVGPARGWLGTSIIRYPEVAILGIGRVEERAVVRGGQVVARPIMPVSLSFDHRVIDGEDGLAFLGTVRDLIEHPERLLLGEPAWS